MLDMRSRSKSASGRRTVGLAAEGEEGGGDPAARMEELRQRWRASREEQRHWQQDVQQSMARWSLQRARVEEEITRRQEASRYACPVPRFYRADSFGDSHGPDSGLGPRRLSLRVEESGSSAESSGDEGASTSSRSLSPYSDRDALYNGYRPPGSPYWTKSRPTSATLDRRQSAIEAEDLLRSFSRRGLSLAEHKVTRALVIPDDKSFEDCISMLPKPGAYLPSGGAVAKKAVKGKKGKKSPKAKKSKKKGSPKKT